MPLIYFRHLNRAPHSCNSPWNVIASQASIYVLLSSWYAVRYSSSLVKASLKSILIDIYISASPPKSWPAITGIWHDYLSYILYSFYSAKHIWYSFYPSWIPQKYQAIKEAIWSVLVGATKHYNWYPPNNWNVHDTCIYIISRLPGCTQCMG